MASQPRQSDPYNSAVRKEVVNDADTGRAIKKWKHRAEGAIAGSVGTAALILGRHRLLRGIKKGAKAVISKHDMSAKLCESMIDAQMGLTKKQIKAWKAMNPKDREAAKERLRMHRRAVDNVSNVQDGGMYFSRVKQDLIELASDGNGRVHNGAGQFAPAAAGADPTAVQRAYSPHDRLSGTSSLTKRKIGTGALKRVAKLV